MWKGKGRSGYGDSTILGDYDTWSGLSPNGRQWHNPVTLETRNLSGQETIERLDEQQRAMEKRFKLGELSKAMYDSIISELRAKQEKAWDKHIEQSICNPLGGKQSEKEKTQESFTFWLKLCYVWLGELSIIV